VSICSNNCDPDRIPEKLVPLMVLNTAAGAPLAVCGRGADVRDWSYVDDHAAVLRQIVARGRVSEAYLTGVCSGRRPQLEKAPA
jgi:dTDP-glucose 4,6-dehydratase